MKTVPQSSGTHKSSGSPEPLSVTKIESLVLHSVPDNRWVATASTDQTTRIWEVASGLTVGVLRGIKGRSPWVAFSPKGHWVLTPGSIWRADWKGISMAQSPMAQSRQFGPNRAIFSPDGRWLLGTGGNGSILWNLETGHPRKLGNFVVSDLSHIFSRDGKLFIGLNPKSGSAVIRDVMTGQIVCAAGLDQTKVKSAFFIDRGPKALTVNDNGTATIWNTENCKALHTIGEPEPHIVAG